MDERLMQHGPTQSGKSVTGNPVAGELCRFFSRELSWLEFNQRVLSEAMDDRTPLLERLKFLAIFSANLDEFFMVRVAALWRKLDAGVEVLSPDGRTPRQQLQAIRDRLAPMVQTQHRYFLDVLWPQLSAAHIHLLDYIDLTPEQRSYLEIYFETQIFLKARGGTLDSDILELRARSPTNRAAPVGSQIPKLNPDRHFSLGIALGRLINVAAGATFMTIHLDRLKGLGGDCGWSLSLA